MRTDDENHVSRRKVLKHTGAATLLSGSSLPALTDVVIAEDSRQNEALQQSTLPFLELSLRSDGIKDGLVAPSGRVYPSFITSGGDAYIMNYGGEDISLDGDRGIVATHMGLQQPSVPATVLEGRVPTTASSTGQNTLLAESQMDASLSIESTGSEATLTFAGEQFALRSKESRELTRTTRVRYRTRDGTMEEQTVDVTLKASNHGEINVVGHSNKLLVPKGSPGGQHFGKLVASSKTVDGVGGSEGPTIEITDLQSVDAFGIRVLTEGGEN